jgi:predicted alpha/beta superfamily hydrolase
MPAITTRRGALFGAGALAAAAAPSPAAATQVQTYVVPFSTVQPLTSRINGVDYQLYVRTPATYAANPDKRYPVIVTLDADYSFPICASHLEHLADRMAQAPEAILVSVAYPNDYPDRDRYRASRTRDYTPLFFPTGGYGPEFQKASGGGPKFLRMLLEEALPLVDAAWRTQPGERTLVGHSYGGLFAAWVLQQHPDAFNRYLMVSPSLWYADKWMFAQEQARPRAPLKRKTWAYLAVGSWEEQPQNKGYMVSEMKQFAELLAARKDSNLEVKSRVFEDETHASIFPAAFSTGIRHLF